MAHAIKLNKSSEIVKTKQADANALAVKYAAVTEEIKNLEQKRTELQEIIRAVMGDEAKLETATGTFAVQERKSYSWSVEQVKLIFPLAWKEYVKPDAALLKERMARKDQSGCELEASADVKVALALTFKATA